ncbi:unnamed protein product [Prorocentrum cordatum]|uniref:Calmodulin n=1 Tax=Prorocentrum cordatum TaxID=2364126 RepID=A0ABN9WQD8_9DINO|nr:unnamed protein product [Polarella glacialis]|mmetsp:Transcript_96449/g.251414  ORF Transcript_96449/g.251414 Transcript_96449/m.251414 type:complete len:249 (-) Transcript_96449:232-978(-)
MAFRGDVHGGSTGLQAGLGLIGGQAEAGIEKKLYVKVGFFTGAVFVVSAAMYSIIHYMRGIEWAPATFFGNVFLLVFGILMVVLDFPIPHPHQSLVDIRDNIYKFVLFMTRFTGRGIWYLFLATLVFSTLWDGGASWLLGLIFTGYLIILGIAALYKGGMMSYKLNKVREEILKSNRSAEHYLAPSQNCLSKVQFNAMVESVMHEHGFFSDDELDYVINSLSFTPENDGQVSMEEIEYWLSDGPMMIV